MEQPLSMSVLFLCFSISLCSQTFKWVHAEEDYSTDGKVLNGHVVAEFSTRYLVTQCAFGCLKEPTCKSFNFNTAHGHCQLNNATHVEFPENVHDSSGFQYHQRDAFSIDEEALGPCMVNPCQNGATCLETKYSSTVVIATCLCANGWMGEYCESEDLTSWSHWEEWSLCSVSVGRGWKMRERNCLKQETMSIISNHYCHGLNVDYGTCYEAVLPVWAEWIEWQDCSSEMKCGRGLTSRKRSCLSDQGYCYEPSQKEFQPCHSINCNGFVRLVNGQHFGEGRVELFNDITQEWGLICGDVWTKRGADILCRQLGFQGANEAVTANEFGVGNGSFAVNSLECPDDAKRLLECSHNKWTIPATCSGGLTAAGVRCIVNGVWNKWSSWSECSVTCERGQIERRRECDYPPPSNGGTKCQGEDVQTEECVLEVCPGNANWTNWGLWSDCDKTCGGGIQRRTRDCLDALTGCTGEKEESKNCNEDNCPVDGVFNEWSRWGTCTLTCGNGTQTRNRTCQVAQYGGRDCEGELNQIQPCNTKECPVNGVFSDWTSWDTCTLTCGNGTQIRKRSCHEPRYGGNDCEGEVNQTQPCNPEECPVDGVFTEWSEWDKCTLTCGNGTQLRYRTCQGPNYGGKDCTGEVNQTRLCNPQECPVDGVFTDWSNWDQCTLTCGNGTQIRNRACQGPYYGGKDCEGDVNQTQSCNPEECPVDGVWDDWSQWGACNATCGGGVKSRNRTCIGPFYGGKECNGAMDEESSCNEQPCPLYGEWYPWNEWSLCSVTCGGGIRSRNRTCNMDVYGNLTVDCPGPSEVSEDCHDFPCHPLQSSCTALGELNFHDSVMVEIDPDGDGPLESLQVRCNMKDEGDIGITLFEHNRQERQIVAANDPSIGDTVDVVYRNVAEQAQIEYVVDHSLECSQFLKWECIASGMHKLGDDAVFTTFWYDRNGLPVDYFPGATPGSYMCACGEAGTCSTIKGPVVCECDINDAVLRSDSGTITRKSDLPVIRFTAGDTEQSPERGYLTVGPLMCWGKG